MSEAVISAEIPKKTSLHLLLHLKLFVFSSSTSFSCCFESCLKPSIMSIFAIDVIYNGGIDS